MKTLYLGADETGAIVLYEQTGDERPQPVSVQSDTWQTWVSLVDSLDGSPGDMLPVRLLGHDVQLLEPEKALHTG